MNKQLYLVVLIFIIASCGVKERITNNLPLSSKSTKDVIYQVNSKENHTDWLSLRGKVRFSEKDQQFNLKTNIYCKKDSIIWISITGALGIEIIRAQLTTDSIYLINRINKTYLTQSISKTNAIINSGLDFYDVHDVVTYNLKIKDNSYKIKTDDLNFYLENNQYSYLISNQFLIKKIKIINKEGTAEIIFDNFKVEDNFPTQVDLKIKSKRNFDLTVNYSKIAYNKPKIIKFQIPEGYEKIN
tara:strand:- start:511 stop:1239 length:729 start_codon:yes stop_codon:yes gene_type:complete